MTIPLKQIASMPAFSPYYPMPPARYRNVRFQYVLFRAEESAVDRILPACFEPSDDGFCAAIGLLAEWSGNYGRFSESMCASGNGSADQSRTTSQAGPNSLFVVQGNSDPLVSFGGGEVGDRFGKKGGKFIATSDTVAIYVKRNGIRRKPTLPC